MATKKRKIDQEDDLLTAASDPLPPTVLYTPAPASDDEDADGDDDEVGKLIEPFSRDQLVTLLRFAAASDAATLDEIRRTADLDPSHRKLFVHGLDWNTTADALRSSFSRYGDIDDCRVIFDKVNGRSKGYGFVLFRHRGSSRHALRRPQKLIDGRMTSCQLASAGSTTNFQNSAPIHLNSNPGPSISFTTYQDNVARKIYVGNVHADVDGSRLLAFFSQYGEIEEGPIGFDRNTGKPKGYALFVYKTAEGAMRALEEPNKNFEGIILQCERANDRSKGAQHYNTAAPLNAAPSKGNLNGPGYSMPVSDIGLAQQAALMGQGFLGMGGAQAYGQAMQSNAAVLALLAAAGQNPAAFGMTPSALTLNPAFATTFGAAGSQQTAPTLPQMVQVPNYGAASTLYQGSAGFQGATGFQGSPGFQGPPGFQAPQGYHSSQSVAQQAAGGGSSYPTGTAPASRRPTGSMGGYGQV